MARYALVRNDNRFTMYQHLSDKVTAVEPPIWMMLREQQLKSEGHEVKVIDTQTEVFTFYDMLEKIREHGADEVEIFPTGNHPSSYIQQKEGLPLLLDHVGKIAKSVKVHETLNFSPIGIQSNWESFDLSKYRAHNWHADWGTLPRSPYGVIYTSIGCPFHCQFCCVKEFYGMTYLERPIEDVVYDIDTLHNHYNMKNIKVMDEIFFFKPDRVERLCDSLINRDYGLNIWAYGRVDTISQKLLLKLKKAGIRWLSLGIESGNEEIRRKSQKGTFTNKKIVEVVKAIKDAGINVVGNFIFGFPDDSYSTMTETFVLAKELQCEFTNLYCMMAYPGSEIYHTAEANNWDLPKHWSGYAQYSIDCHPVRTHHLTSEEVLKFRDDSFHEFYGDADFKRMIGSKFGNDAVSHIDEMLKVKLRRRLLEVCK
jgi:radical SAM superfamily enzyme YgiQ (UPF0313 family)